MRTWFVALTALIALVPAPAAAEETAHTLFGLEEGHTPVLPGDVPVFGDAAGSKVALVVSHKKKGCDPEDEYDEGRCDFEIKLEIRGADGKVIEKVSAMLGNWKKKTDVATLAAKLQEHGLVRGKAVEMGDRFYTFAGDKKLVIDGAGKKVRLRVLGAGDKVLHERELPKQCPGKGDKTIWGADAFWVEESGILFVLPRACSKPTLQVVPVAK